MFILFANLVGNNCVIFIVHLWYLLSLLDKEKDGFQGYYILMPGLILLRLLTCFW